MIDWSPDSPNTCGLAWFPLAGAHALDADAKAIAGALEQTQAGTIDTVRVNLPTVSQAGAYQLEVYDGETAEAANVATLTARPNEDVSLGSWTEDDGTTTTIFDQMDEATLDYADYVQVASGGSYVWRAATAALSLTGKRILAVRLVYVGEACCSSIGFACFSAFFDGGLRLGGVDYVGGYEDYRVTEVLGAGTMTGCAAGTPSRFRTTNTWLSNPAQGRPWRIADVQALDSTDGLVFYATVVKARIYQAYVEVIVCDENRIAVSSEKAVAAAGWNDFTGVTTPTGGAWAKDSSGRHLYLVRRKGGSGIATVRTMDSGQEMPNIGRCFVPTIDPTYRYVTAMGDADSRVLALVQRTTAPADSDSQPYQGAVSSGAEVYASHDAEQELSEANSSTAGNYRRVTFLAKPVDASSDPLTIKIKRRSDNVQMGGDGAVTAANALAEADYGSGWRLVTVTLASDATLANGVQYYVEFSCAAAAVGTGWYVYTLDTLNVGELAGFGGTTDVALVASNSSASAEDTQYDIPLLLQSVPNAPANFAATITARDQAGDGDGCQIGAVDVATITWDATALGANFARYELERSDDGGTTWERIAEPETEATETWVDPELRRATPTRYRLRVVRADEATSNWVTSSDVEAETECCELIFTTAQNLDLTVAYTHPPGITHDFPSSGDRVLVPIYLRDGFVSFRRSEDRYQGFELDVRVFARQEPGDPADVPPDGEGVAAFDSLRALADDPALAYVCVLDPVGNRWFAELAVPNGTEDRGRDVYMARIRVDELTRTPTVPTSQ